jgi:hypothetical protein
MTSVALTIAVMVTTLFQFGLVSAAARDGTIDEVIPKPTTWAMTSPS